MSAKVARAQIQFMQWVKDTNPGLYAAALRRAEQQTENDKLSGLGEENQPSLWEKFTTGIMSLGTTYLTVKNQRDIMDLNMRRAEQGLAPIDAATTAPVVRTQIDLDPSVVDRLTSQAGISLNKILLFGGAALAAFLLLNR